jgi:hypothetical protein
MELSSITKTKLDSSIKIDISGRTANTFNKLEELNKMSAPAADIMIFEIPAITTTLFQYLNMIEIHRFLLSSREFYFNNNILECWASKYDIKKRIDNFKNKKFNISNINTDKKTISISSNNNILPQGHFNISATFFDFYKYLKNKNINISSSQTSPELQNAILFEGDFSYIIKDEFNKQIILDLAESGRNIKEINNYCISVNKNIWTPFSAADIFLKFVLFNTDLSNIDDDILKIESETNPFSEQFYKKIISAAGCKKEAAAAFFKFTKSTGGRFYLKLAIKFIQFPELAIKHLISAEIFDINFILFYQRNIPAAALESIIIKKKKEAKTIELMKDFTTIMHTISLRSAALTEEFIDKFFTDLDIWALLRPDLQLSPEILIKYWDTWPKPKLLSLEWFIKQEKYYQLRQKLIVTIVKNNIEKSDNNSNINNKDNKSNDDRLVMTAKPSSEQSSTIHSTGDDNDCNVNINSNKKPRS